MLILKLLSPLILLSHVYNYVSHLTCSMYNSKNVYFEIRKLFIRYASVSYQLLNYKIFS